MIEAMENTVIPMWAWCLVGLVLGLYLIATFSMMAYALWGWNRQLNRILKSSPVRESERTRQPAVHVYPQFDDHHVLTERCWCNPRVEYVDSDTGQPYAVPLVTHNGCEFGAELEQAEGSWVVQRVD